MKYLSFDIEATGLEEHDAIIEFSCVPFCASSKQIAQDLKYHTYVKCDSFESLKPKLNQWVIDNNKSLIEKAHTEGLKLNELKQELTDYLKSKPIQEYFELDNKNNQIILFGKSMNAIDLPFLNRDLGYDFMRDFFSHRVLDLTSVTMAYCDSGLLPTECLSGSKLMQHFSMGEVAHTAYDDAKNTALLYFKMLELQK